MQKTRIMLSRTLDLRGRSAWNLKEHGLFSEIYGFIISPLHFFTSASISVLRCVPLINSCFATISLCH